MPEHVDQLPLHVKKTKRFFLKFFGRHHDETLEREQEKARSHECLQQINREVVLNAHTPSKHVESWYGGHVVRIILVLCSCVTTDVSIFDQKRAKGHAAGRSS